LERDIISRTFFMGTRGGPHTSEGTRSKGVREEEILWLQCKAKNLVSLQPLQLEISWLSKVPKSHVDAKNLNEMQKHDWRRHIVHLAYDLSQSPFKMCGLVQNI